MNITTVIVTFNRRLLLERCLKALQAQTHRPDRVLIVDNASSDGTQEWLADWLPANLPQGEVLALNDNLGGAGGFAAGIQYAVDTGAEWIWIMDDDAEPHEDALERLVDVGPLPENFYGSVATSNDRLSWPMMPKGGTWRDAIYTISQLTKQVEVQFIPFLGLFINRQIVLQIGPPDAGFFIAADDVDYCLRARSHGAQIIMVGGSHIEHPASERYSIPLPWRRFYSLKLTPWKRYYDVRNRLFVAKNHYGAALYYSTIPGSFLRLIATLWHEGDRLAQIKAFTAGMIDGLSGRKGRRHEKWGLKP